MAIYEKPVNEATVTPLADHVGLFIDEADNLAYLRLPDGSTEPLKGDTGAAGPTGPGVPTGGTAGQFLRKASGVDFDTAFAAVAQSEVTNLVADLAAKALDADLTAEESARIAADAALDTRVDALELAPPAHTHVQADVTDLVGDLGNIDSRLDQLELGSPPPEAQGTWLASGGSVVFLQDYDFRVSAATYYINGVQFSAPQTNITLDAADATDDRFDAIVVTSAGTVVKVTGTPAANPALPDIDPETQLALTYIFVQAASTNPGITVTDIYLEDTEWTSSVSGGTFNAASVVDPLAGTKSVEATAAAAGDFVRFTNGATISLNDKKQLTINIKSKATWPNQKSVQATWYNAGVKKGQSVAIGNNKFGFVSSNTTAYQQIVLPISAFAVPIADVVDRLELKVAGGGGTIGFFADNIILEHDTGTVTQPSVGAATATTLGLVRTDITDANPQVYLKSSVDTLLAAKAALAGATFTGDVVVPDEVYGVGWNGNNEVPTKNALFDKIETVVAGAPAAHAASHENGGGDEISVAGLSGLLADGQTPLAHKTSHENGGADEISVAGLSGLLADEQTPLAHSAAKITSGLLALARGGTNADLSATGSATHFLRQASAGADVTVGAIVASDVPSLDAAKITTGVFTDARLASDNDAGNSGVADTIDWSLARSQKSTLTGNVVYTFSNPVAGATYVLRVHTGAGGFTTAWPAEVHWANGTAPTTTVTATKVDIYTFHFDGTTYFGVISGQNFTP